MAETGREEDSRQEEAVELHEAKLRVRIREKKAERREWEVGRRSGKKVRKVGVEQEII
jgi:hypothetical protein